MEGAGDPSSSGDEAGIEARVLPSETIDDEVKTGCDRDEKPCEAPTYQAHNDVSPSALVSSTAVRDLEKDSGAGDGTCGRSGGGAGWNNGALTPISDEDSREIGSTEVVVKGVSGIDVDRNGEVVNKSSEVPRPH